MKNFFIMSQFVFLFFSSYFASASDQCMPNMIEFDVCKYAKNLADEASSQLPMRMSNNLMIEKVFAFKNLFSMHVMYGYDEKALYAKAKKNNISIKQINQQIEKSTKANLCQDESPTKSFISLGGKVQYVYKFSDGMPYITVNVDSCE